MSPPRWVTAAFDVYASALPALMGEQVAAAIEAALGGSADG
jgi:hypothetical protein